MTTTATSVYSLISEALDRIEDPDPMAVAAVVVDQLDDGALRHEAMRGIAEKVRQVYSRQRGKAGGRAPASARWAAVANDQASGELDLARLPIFNGKQTKLLLDCDRTDLQGAIADHERIVTVHTHSAEQLRRLERLMVRRKARLVRDLPAEKVREVFNA